MKVMQSKMFMKECAMNTYIHFGPNYLLTSLIEDISILDLSGYNQIQRFQEGRSRRNILKIFSKQMIQLELQDNKLD